MKTIKDFFKKHNIEFYSMIPLSRLKVTKEYLLSKNGFDKNDYAIMMLFPYRSEKKPENLTAYASVKDYHFFVSRLSLELENFIRTSFKDARFKVFSDHSPFDEVHASCISGLGFIGDNGLLINEKYSSFIFIGECVTNLTPEELGLDLAPICEVKGCLHCGACARACPSGCIGTGSDKKIECLSAITQKKGELLPIEEKMIIENGSIWGCDACANACPYTKGASYTPIEFFKEDVITLLDLKKLNSLSDEEFNMRPFAWRGRKVLERNVLLYEKFRREK